MPDKILIIDDSRDVHALVKARLAKERVTIHSAFDGSAGIEAAHALRPDLIMLDIDMPDPDGFVVCRQLKADSATMHIPVIFLTGTSTTEEKIRGLDMGAADYVTKPFDPAELCARVRASLRTKTLVDLLAKKAMIDGLTGLWNRLYLDARLSAELAASRRNGTPLACIMADIDYFKSINDTYGHGFGDEVLREVSATFTASCRENDVVCRYGGEEFAILLPSTNDAQAVELAERLRAAIEKIPLTYRDTPVRITCSFGVSDLKGQAPPSVMELADNALYQAKNAGRNCVHVCAQAPAP